MWAMAQVQGPCKRPHVASDLVSFALSSDPVAPM